MHTGTRRRHKTKWECTQRRTQGEHTGSTKDTQGEICTAARVQSKRDRTGGKGTTNTVFSGVERRRVGRLYMSLTTGICTTLCCCNSTRKGNKRIYENKVLYGSAGM